MAIKGVDDVRVVLPQRYLELPRVLGVGIPSPLHQILVLPLATASG
jgi:hypothetical protein